MNGGIDYITKPFQVKEVLARVKTHLALAALQKDLKAQNAMLQLEVAERKRAEEALHATNAKLERETKINFALAALSAAILSPHTTNDEMFQLVLAQAKILTGAYLWL